MTIEAQKEHMWLKKLVGDWTFEGVAAMEPGKPPEHFSGTESVRPLGDFWIVAEGRGEMPGGGAAATMMTLGYDPQGKRYVGTWVGSMMTHLWLYEGALDADGSALALDTEGPDMSAGGKVAMFRDVIELKNDDHRVLTSHRLGEKGKWQVIMTANYRRKK